MCDTTNPSTQSIADYLAQLLKDRKQLAAFPNVFMHMERLLDEGSLRLTELWSSDDCNAILHFEK
ncbi:held out wing [Danaus plexippus plexippus]|uniref:Held out wing n=1 Tax=Danaus plexippus plexippus TaxID=278856 RepID=A0A212EWN1_DANPL|nr:held out wing [Danaus plexippus plexippus]